MLHIEDVLMRQIYKSKKTLLPSMTNVRKLRALANEIQKMMDDKRNKVYELAFAQFDYLYAEHRQADFGITKLVREAAKSASDRLRFMSKFDGADEGADYEMFQLMLRDASDHLHVAVLLHNGASRRVIRNRLWYMDTASREEMSTKVWDWLNEEPR